MDYKQLNVPMPDINKPHWKVGDGVLDRKNGDPWFIISQMVLVLIDEENVIFELRWYDLHGNLQVTKKIKYV